MRAQEAREAGKLAGIEVLDGVFDDLDIYSDNAESRNKVVEVIQYAQPDFIITHNPDDYMPDHTATAKLVFDASSLRRSPTGRPRRKRPPSSFQSTTWILWPESISCRTNSWTFQAR